MSFPDKFPEVEENGFRAMPANVEIKARAKDLDALRDAARRLSGTEPEHLRQRDTFFHARKGRLKLRELDGRRAELIAYERPDDAGPKRSEYSIVRVDAREAEALRHVLTASLGVTGVVTKRRSVFLVGQTRVHLDSVDGLGDFVELEVVLRDGQSTREGEQVARDLMRRLGIGGDDLVEGAYVDLLTSRR